MTFVMFCGAKSHFSATKMYQSLYRTKNKIIMETINKTQSDTIFGLNTEFHRFGLISAVLLLIGCLGGITVGLGAVESVLALSLVVIPTMTTLSLMLAVAPMKYILRAGIVSVTIDALFIAYYLFLA